MYDDGIMFGRAVAERRGAERWKAYAKNLENQLRISQANTAGMETLKDAAMKELMRLDPSNYLMIKQNRQRVFDSAYDPIAEGRSAA